MEYSNSPRRTPAQSQSTTRELQIVNCKLKISNWAAPLVVRLTSQAQGAWT
jgi:hypothetical protein